MKRFYQLITSLLIPVIVLGSFTQLRENFEWAKVLKERPEVVIMGDSHAEPLCFENGVTLANGGDPFLMPLLHLRRLQKASNLEEVKTFILTVGPHNFAPLQEDRLLNNFDNWVDSNSGRIANALVWSDYGNIEYSYLPLLQICKQELLLFNKRVNTSVANWNDSPQLDSIRTANRLNRHRILDKNWFQAEGIQRENFEKIIEFTREKNAQLVVVGTPLHLDYRRQVEQFGMIQYYNFLDSVASANKHLSYCSFESTPWPDSFFKDCDHINHKGSIRLMEMLSNEITQLH